MAFLGPYNAALINPSLVLLSKDIGVDSKTAAYTTTTGIILGGISPFLWTPLTNYYGRRPITLCAILLTILGGVGSGVSPGFNALVGTRALCGFGFGGMMSVGTACVNDMFFLHERGAKTGVYSIFVTNGAHVAALSKRSQGPCPFPLPFRYRSLSDVESHLISHSRRLLRPSRGMEMGLLARRNQHGALLHRRPVPLPRNPLFSRPRLSHHPHSDTNLLPAPVRLQRQHDPRSPSTCKRFPPVFQNAQVSIDIASRLVLLLGLDIHQRHARNHDCYHLLSLLSFEGWSDWRLPRDLVDDRLFPGRVLCWQSIRHPDDPPRQRPWRDAKARTQAIPLHSVRALHARWPDNLRQHSLVPTLVPHPSHRPRRRRLWSPDR
jgi:Major Facilitator Superfamily